MKVSSRHSRVVNPLVLSTYLTCVVCVGRHGEVPPDSEMLQGYGDAVLRAETLEEQLVKSRKHAAAM
jgi:hypothetical protein